MMRFFKLLAEIYQQKRVNSFFIFSKHLIQFVCNIKTSEAIQKYLHKIFKNFEDTEMRLVFKIYGFVFQDDTKDLRIFEIFHCYYQKKEDEVHLNVHKFLLS